MQEFFVAPTEPKQLKALGKSTLMPERFGCDVVWYGKDNGEDQLWGVQRKELKDLIASVSDGRISKEIAQMRASGIPIPMIVIEGKVQFDTAGNLLWNSWGQQFTRGQWKGMLWSMMNEGAHIEYTKDITETVELVVMYARWTNKDKHTSIMRRPSAFSPWGNATNDDYAVHLLQGFDGLGTDRAKAIIKHFKGVPLAWTVTKEQMMEVPGIGKVIANKLIDALLK